MGSHCTKVKQTLVIWPVAVTPDMTSPGSLEGLDRIPCEEHSNEKKPCKCRQNHHGSAAKTKEGEDVDGIRENHDTNISHSRISDDSGYKRTFQYKKGPAIDSNNPFAEVCECLDLVMGERLAIKTYKVHGALRQLREQLELLQDEITVLQDLFHENLIRYDGMEFHEVKEENKMIEIDIIMEYASGGSVWGLIQKFSNLDERVVQNYTRQILDGLTYLHSEGLVHGNLKGSNVLIDSNGVIKLTDIQSTNRIKYFIQRKPHENDQIDFFIDSIYWTAPEVLISKKIETASDIWSVGCVILEMLTGLPPWESRGRDEAEKRILAGYLPPIPDCLSDTCKDFLGKIFKFNPEERPSIQELYEHAFLQVGTEKNTEESSTESLRTIRTQSFSMFRANTGNTALQSMNSLTQNTPDTQSYDPNNKYNIAINNNYNNPNQILGNKLSPGRSKNTLFTKKMTSDSVNGLPHVEETNIEEEEGSPNEKFNRVRSSVQIKNDWSGFQLVGGNNGDQKVSDQNGFLKIERDFNIRKSKTEEYLGTAEEGERVDLNKNVLEIEDIDDQIQTTDQAIKKPFAPVRASLFKKTQRETDLEEKHRRYSIKDGDSNKDEASPSMSQSQQSQQSQHENPTTHTHLSQEDQRKQIEQDLANQLLRINTKDLSREFSSSNGGSHYGESRSPSPDYKKIDEMRKRFEEEVRKQLGIEVEDLMNNSEIMIEETRKAEGLEVQAVENKEEQRKKFEEEMKRQLERINTVDLVAMKMSDSMKVKKTLVEEKEAIKNNAI